MSNSACLSVKARINSVERGREVKKGCPDPHEEYTFENMVAFWAFWSLKKLYFRRWICFSKELCSLHCWTRKCNIKDLSGHLSDFIACSLLSSILISMACFVDSFVSSFQTNGITYGDFIA